MASSFDVGCFIHRFHNTLCCFKFTKRYLGAKAIWIKHLVDVCARNLLHAIRVCDASVSRGIREVLYAYQASNDGVEAASATFSQPAAVGEMFLPNKWGYNDFFCTSARACNDKAWRHAA